eukprot:SAG22_NODE_103_length_20175_cov_15.280833_4_plen_314_part_00
MDAVQRRRRDGGVAALDVLRHRPGQAADPHRDPGTPALQHRPDLGGDQLDRLEVAGRGDREAGLADIDAELRDLLRQRQLLGRVERGARRLLAVAERGVEDDQLVELGAGGGRRRRQRPLRLRRAVRRGGGGGGSAELLRHCPEQLGPRQHFRAGGRAAGSRRCFAAAGSAQASAATGRSPGSGLPQLGCYPNCYPRGPTRGRRVGANAAATSEYTAYYTWLYSATQTYGYTVLYETPGAAAWTSFTRIITQCHSWATVLDLFHTHHYTMSFMGHGAGLAGPAGAARAAGRPAAAWCRASRGRHPPGWCRRRS